MPRFFFFILVTFLCCTEFVSAKSARYADIHYEDVTLRSTEMIQHHASFNEIDDTLAQRILDRFLFELDPMKLFLLQSEVEPWIHPTSDMLSEIKREFAKGEFPQFETLFSLRLSALKRNEGLELLSKQLPLPSPSTIAHISNETIADFCWAKDSAELMIRLRTIQALEEKAVARFEPEVRKKIWERFEKRKKMLLDRDVCQNKQDKEKCIATLLLKAFACALDAHTSYFTSAEANVFISDVQQRIFGIGVLFRDDIDGFTVLELVDGGPASKQGKIKINDKVIAVDHEPIIGDDLIEVVDKIRGKEHTPVTLTVVREAKDSPKETFNTTIRRGAIVLPESRLESKILSSKSGPIGYLRLSSFYQDEKTSSSSDLRQKIIEMKRKNTLIGIVLDLRGNPGGILQQAVEVCGLFMDTSLICSVKEGESIYPFWSMQSKKVWDGPLAVLTDRTSASASEIVAQTLQDWNRAIILGDDRTFGKGSFQMLSFYSDGATRINPKGEYKITRGRYYTTSGKSPQLVGVKPDIEVYSPFRFMKIGEEFSTYPLSNESIPSYFENPNLFTPNIPQEKDWLKNIQNIFSRASFIQNFQKKDDFLAISIHFLQKNSKNRLLQSKEYQEYITSLQNKEMPKETEQKETKPTDFQLNETIEVIQDFVHFQAGAAAA